MALDTGELVADLFCGAGGWGEGAREVGVLVDIAVNHSPVAIETHRKNNPECRHFQGDAWRVRPRDCLGSFGRGRRLGLLMASAACTTHSRARGSAPVSPRVHMLGWCIARWMRDEAPRMVEIENVPEWKDWGPTTPKRDDRGRIVRDAQGRVVRVQDPARKGSTFRRWWRYCERLGYRMEMRVLDAPDYGCASRRRRLFIKARNDGRPIVWPKETHGNVHEGADSGRVPGERAKDGRGRGRRPAGADAVQVDLPGLDRGGEHGVPGGGGHHPAPRVPYRTAAECIDWSDLGSSIFERERPLKPKTLARIAEGIRRYVLNDPRPFVLRVTQTGGAWAVAAVDEPLRTQTTRQDLAVATPIFTPAGGTVFKPSRCDEPYHAVLTREDTAIATPVMVTTGYGEREGQLARVHRVGELLGTSVTGVKQAVVAPVLMNNTTHHVGGRVDGTVPTITTGGQGAVVAPVMAYLNHGGKQVGGVDEPLRTIVAGGRHEMLVAALMLEYYGNTAAAKRPDRSLGCVTTLDRHGLVCCVVDGTEYVVVDILFRMLRPAELAKAMGFRPDYQWPRTQRETVRLIGNAVAPPVARALVAASVGGGA